MSFVHLSTVCRVVVLAISFVSTVSLAADRFGALTFSPEGPYGATWGTANLADAVAGSIGGCLKEGGKECTHTATTQNGCIALAWSRLGVASAWGANTTSEAQQQAVNSCRQTSVANGKSPDLCLVTYWFCVDGSQWKRPASEFPPDRFAAITVSPEGTYGWAKLSASRAEAEAAATSSCISSGGRECTCTSFTQNGCVALALNSTGINSTWGGNSPDEAQQKSLGECRQANASSGRSPDGCAIALWVCADGRQWSRDPGARPSPQPAPTPAPRPARNYRFDPVFGGVSYSDVRPTGGKPDFSLVGEKAKLWRPGQSIRVRFLSGSQSLQDEIWKAISQWFPYVNLRISRVTSGEAEIRIRAPGSDNVDTMNHSFVGNDSATKSINADGSTNSASASGPSISYAERRTGTYLHEFGHALGFGHEHQSPNASFDWNKDRVYQDLQGPPNNWSKDTIDWNVFRSLDSTTVSATAFDPRSIMIYAIPKEWLNTGEGVANPETLSAMDRAFAAILYPLQEGDRCGGLGPNIECAKGLSCQGDVIEFDGPGTCKRM